MRLPPKLLVHVVMVFLACTGIALTGCKQIHGRPAPGPEVLRPEQVLSFNVLYQQNCAACHGDNGRNGASIALANPAYLAVAGEERIHSVITKGVSSSLMPPFASSAGGTLTDQQVTILAHGILQKWATPESLSLQNAPTYQSELQGDVHRGQQAFAAFCSRCHGASGEGTVSKEKGIESKVGSIVDPAYLALMSNQGLRSIVIAGRPDEGMPDWRSDSTQPMTDQQITDVVAWLAAKRVADPGQPYGAK